MATCFGTMLQEQFSARADAGRDYQDQVARATEELHREMAKSFTKGAYYEQQKAPGYPLGKLFAGEVLARWIDDEEQAARLLMFISKCAAGLDVQVEAKKLIEDCAAWHADQHATDLVAQWEDEE